MRFSSSATFSWPKQECCSIWCQAWTGVTSWLSFGSSSDFCRRLARMERVALNDCVATCGSGSAFVFRGEGSAVRLLLDLRLELLDMHERSVADTVCMWPCGVSPSVPSNAGSWMCGRHGDSSLWYGEYKCPEVCKETYLRTNSMATTTVSRCATNCALYRYRDGECVGGDSSCCFCLVVPRRLKLGVLKLVKVS